jgi:hypothetical protein
VKRRSLAGFPSNILIMIATTNKTSPQRYTIIRTGKDFEIRFYPSVTIATVTSPAKSHKELAGAGFRQLAAYIFGGNESKQQIAMTSPVHMDINDSLSSMSFVMPSQYNKSNIPKPINREVMISNTPDEYVAALKFSGFASDKDIKKYTEKLEQALKQNGITYYGNFRFLGYDAPYKLFGRRNEIIVSIPWFVSA